MDSKLLHQLKNQKKSELVAWQQRRQALVSRNEPDSDPLQPLHGDWAYGITVPTIDGSQLGGRVAPLSFETLAVNMAGLRTGQVLMKLASTEDMQKFNEDEAAMRAQIKAEKAKAENRTSINVAPVPPAARSEKA